MDDKVISLASRLPLAVEEAMQQRAIEEEAARQEIATLDDFATTANMLSNALELLMKQRLTGLMLLGQDPVTGFFYHDINIRSLDRQECFGYMGVLQSLIIELQQHAAMAPTINAQGEIVDPYEEVAQ